MRFLVHGQQFTAMLVGSSVSEQQFTCTIRLICFCSVGTEIPYLVLCSENSYTRFWEQEFIFYSQQCAVWLIGFCSVGTAMRNWVYEQQICRHSDDLFGSWTAIHSNVNWFICFLNSNSHALFVSSGSVRHINALLGSWTAIHSNVSWFICFWTAILMRYLFHLVLLGT